MSETEVERLVVRLTGDNSEYAKMLSDSRVQTQQVAAQLESTTKRIEAFSGTLTGFGTGVLGFFGALGLKGYFDQAMSEWDKREQGIIRMGAVLQANGRNVEATTSQYRDFAKQLSSITTESNGAILSLLRQAESYQLTGAGAQRAVQTSIALGAATEQEAQTFLAFAAAMEKGDLTTAMHLKRQIRQLRDVTDESQLFARTQQLVAQGMATSSALSKTNNHEMERAKRAIKGLMGDIGELLDNALAPFATMLKDSAEWLRGMSKESKAAAAVILGIAAALLFIPPLLGGIMSVLTPLFGLFMGGFAVISAGIGILLSPFLILKGILIGIAVIGATIFSPLGLAIAAVTLVVIGLTRRFGGMQSIWKSVADWAVAAWDRIKTVALAAWDYISAKALAFWEWLQPITDAAAAFAVTAWGIIKDVALATWDWITERASEAWQWIKGVWEDIFGSAEVNWGDVQDVIQRVILFAEFTLLNFGQVSALVWAGIKLEAMVVVDTMRNGLVGLVAAGAATCMTLGRTFTDLWAIIRGDTSGPVRGIAEQWREDFQTVAESLGAGSSELTDRLRAEFAEMRGAVGQSFEDFVAQRRQEFAALNRTTAAATPKNSPGAQEQEQMKKAVKEAEKFDAVLRGSSEALSRIAAYRDRLGLDSLGDRSSTSGGGGRGGTGISSVSPATFSASPSPAPTTVVQDPARDRMVELLVLIEGHLSSMAGRRPLVISTSGIS